ncbi:hypothetical protein HRI_003639300 [Hibiscus trionum]|uniref:Reverse transcriptase domain-containing protein n=1 Tax=Hibiscus trionum TaxID=183268 RepID=A0A9W7IQS0_HIBTR|nr:hypothetical protein HRI_003639300 [Hibiscus trionum]
MNIKTICWNAQGCGHQKILTAARQYIRVYRPDIFGIVEPRISGSRADFVVGSLGFPLSHRIEALGFSGGIWLCWRDTVHVTILLQHFQFLHCEVTCRHTGFSFFLTLVYASPTASKRKTLWPHLHRLAQMVHCPWLLMGDFNATLDTSERKGGTGSTQASHLFQDFIFNCGLRDIGFQGPQFTWSRGSTYARLDRMICNEKWDEYFPGTSVLHLLRIHSDHRPLFLQFGNARNTSTSRHFRYFTGWRLHADFDRMVSDAWQSSNSLTETISQFTSAAEVWNTTVFGYIGAKKRSIMARLRGAQKALERRHSSFLVSLEHDLRLELETLLDQEELLWQQKSRSDWISSGDRNTAYFHRIARQRKARNRIQSLQLLDGTWCDDEAALCDEAVSFFKNLYAVNTPSSESYSISGMFPFIEHSVMTSLCAMPSKDEIYVTLCEMAPLKAPGPDGLHAEFFQKNWRIVGNDVCRAILHVFQGGILEPSFSRAMLILVPKLDVPQTIADFRPIGLCSVIYKLLTKIIVRRLKSVMPRLIHPTQTGFISGRSINDNVILNQEIIHSMRVKKTKQGWMALKIDLEKAFDRVRWDFLQDTLEDVGFPSDLIRIIMHCVTSATIQVQWNGSLSSPFSPERGIRQGDPLSPYLFVLTMERLGQAIRQSVDSGAWKPFRMARSGIPLSHLFFADDLILYAKADISQAQVISDVLKEFEKCSGHKVSVRKSQIYFSPNTNPSLQDEICMAIGFQKTLSLGTYLGVPVRHERMRIADFDFILDRIRSKLNGWAARCLSLAGRITLAKSVLEAIPTYFMQTAILPIGVCANIDKLVRGFIWGSSASAKKISLVNWEVLTQPLRCGGLGVPRSHERNMAYMAKLAWFLISRPNDLWVRALREKYKITCLCPASISRTNSTPLWRGISNAWDLIRGNVHWLLGNGHCIDVWHDTWVPSLGPLVNWTVSAATPPIIHDFNSLLNENGQWNFDRLSTMLKGTAIPHVLGILPPQNDAERDEIAWSRNPSGEFTLASAYRTLMEATWNDVDALWLDIWALQVPQRIRTFLWLVVHFRLLTNVERERRYITSDPSCTSCGCAAETILHVLRDCPTTRHLWHSIVPHENHEVFFQLSLRKWIAANIHMTKPMGPVFVSWSLLFASLVWQIWKRRNDFMFMDSCSSLPDAYRISLTWAMHFGGKVLPSRQATIGSHVAISWQPLPQGLFCLNTDAAVSITTSIGSVGGVIRGSTGEWVTGYNKRIGYVSPLQAELWGILIGLEVAWSLGIERLQIQTDSKQALNLLMSNSITPLLPLVRAINSFRRCAWYTELVWIPRSCNVVADAMSKISNSNYYQLQLYATVPREFQPLLQQDAGVLM